MTTDHFQGAASELPTDPRGVVEVLYAARARGWSGKVLGLSGYRSYVDQDLLMRIGMNRAALRVLDYLREHTGQFVPRADLEALADDDLWIALWRISNAGIRLVRDRHAPDDYWMLP